MQGLFLYLAAAGFLLGIALEFLVLVGVPGAVALMLCGVVVSLLGVLLRCVGAGALMGVVLLAASLGVVRTGVVQPVRTAVLDAYIGSRVEVQGVVVDEPDVRESSVRITINTLHASSSKISGAAEGKVIAIVPPHSAVSYGDTVTVSGTLTLPRSFSTGEGLAFDYPHFLAVSGVGYLLERGALVAHDEGKGGIKRVLFSIKNTFVRGLSAALPEPEHSLAAGLLLGEKGLPKDVRQAFTDTGLVHIVVLSGYNITIVVGALLALCGMFGRRTRFTIGGITILLFVLMTGASATGVRAGIMATLSLLATVLYRPHAAGRALLVAGVAMVAWNPRVLLYDPGFQLSFVATVGIIYVAPVISRRLFWVTRRLELRDIVAGTLGTQLLLVPLLLRMSGTMSVVSVPMNVLVLPFVPLAMALSGAAGLLGVLLPEALAPVVGLPARLVLGAIIGGAEWAAALPFATVPLPLLGSGLTAFFYVAASLLVWRFSRALPSEKEHKEPRE